MRVRITGAHTRRASDAREKDKGERSASQVRGVQQCLREGRGAGARVAFASGPSEGPRLRAAICECGAQPHEVRDFLALRRLTASRECAVALVSMPAEISESTAALETMRTLRQNGFSIVACADGSQAWTIGQRCLPLIAGATELLDSSCETFVADLRDLLTRTLEAVAAAHAERQSISETMRALGIVGASDAMISVFRTTLRVSNLSDVPVLLTGETGTGKGLLAQAIHRLDPKRSGRPFVALNCGAISAGIAESELFGHRRGAFTGADRDRKGLFRSAEGGVLFLDEIGEMDPLLQVKLLRVLHEGRVLAVGEESEVAVNIRVIAATNRDLPQMVMEKKFRADLFHRLSVLWIDVPPLRDRRSDVGPLVEHLLAKHSSLSPEDTVIASAEFIEALEKIEHPGNVRELEHLICHTLVHKRPGSSLKLGDLPPGVWRQLSAQPAVDERADKAPGGGAGNAIAAQQPAVLPDPSLVDPEDWKLSQFLEQCEKLLLQNALRQTRGNQSKTARLLGITPRSVYNKLIKHRLRL